MNPTRPLAAKCVVVGRGAGLEPKTIAPGTTGQVLTTVTTGAEPVFTAPATVSLTTGVTGVLPVANGGTGQAVGAIALMQFTGTAVPAGGTVFLGRDDDATEINVEFRVPAAGSILSIAAAASVAAGAGQTNVYTVRVEAADTAATVTMTGTGGGGRSIHSGGFAVGFVFGSRINIKLVTSAGAGVANHMVTVAMRVDAVA